jgi:serine/threonine protein kinase
MLLDVGSAGHADNRCTIPVCTITHRSPDILHAEIEKRYYQYDGKCLDIWSLGILLIEIYTGPEPFGPIVEGMSATHMLANIMDKKDRVLENVGTKCEPKQLALLLRCLDNLPTRRPTIAELRGGFE